MDRKQNKGAFDGAQLLTNTGMVEREVSKNGVAPWLEAVGNHAANRQLQTDGVKSPKILQRYIRIKTNCSDKTYKKDEDHRALIDGAEQQFRFVRYKQHLEELRQKLDEWLSDETMHTACSYKELAKLLFMAVVPAPTVDPGEGTVYEGNIPKSKYSKPDLTESGVGIAGLEERLTKLEKIGETVGQDMALDLESEALDEETAAKQIQLLEENLKQLRVLLRLLTFYKNRLGLAIMDKKEGKTQIGWAMMMRMKEETLRFEYLRKKYSISLVGDRVGGGSIGNNGGSYDALCTEAIKQIKAVMRNATPALKEEHLEELSQIRLAEEVAKVLWNTSGTSIYPGVIDLCAIFSSAEAKRCGHNLFSAAIAAANFEEARNAKETFSAFMDRTNAFWRDGGASASRTEEGRTKEVQFLALFEETLDVVDLHLRLMRVRDAKMKLLGGGVDEMAITERPMKRKREELEEEKTKSMDEDDEDTDDLPRRNKKIKY